MLHFNLEEEQAKAPSTYSDDVHLPNRSRPPELKENGNIQGWVSGLCLDFAEFDFKSSAHCTLPPKLLCHLCRIISCPGRTRQTPEQPNQRMPIPVLPPGCQDENHNPISDRPQMQFSSLQFCKVSIQYPLQSFTELVALFALQLCNSKSTKSRVIFPVCLPVQT